MCRLDSGLGFRGLGVWRLGFGGLGFRGLGFRGLGFRVKGLVTTRFKGFRIASSGLAFTVKEAGLKPPSPVAAKGVDGGSTRLRFRG